MTIHQHQAIRAKLFNPPVKLTKAAFEEHEAEIKSLKRTIANLTTDVQTRAEVVSRLVAEIQEERKKTDFLTKQIAELTDMSSIPASTKRRSVKAIIADVLADWPGVTWKLVIGGRRSWHIVRCRHLCMQAVYEQRPDLSLPQIGRIFHKDHSTVCYAVYKRSPHRKSVEYIERVGVAEMEAFS